MYTKLEWLTEWQLTLNHSITQSLNVSTIRTLVNGMYSFYFMSNTLVKIRSFFINEILKRNDSDISNDLDLRDSGILSSLATMHLVSFLEDQFGIIVGVSDPRTRFITIREIANYVDEKSSCSEE